MAITVPAPGDVVDATTFGKPVADAVNHMPGRVWLGNLTTIDANTGGWATIPGSNISVSETLPRKWYVIVSIGYDVSGASKIGYIRWYLDNTALCELPIYFAWGSAFSTFSYSVTTPMAAASTKLELTGWKIASGKMMLVDGGP
jgi:hypothetical protein